METKIPTTAQKIKIAEEKGKIRLDRSTNTAYRFDKNRHAFIFECPIKINGKYTDRELEIANERASNIFKLEKGFYEESEHETIYAAAQKEALATVASERVDLDNIKVDSINQLVEPFRYPAKAGDRIKIVEYLSQDITWLLSFYDYLASDANAQMSFMLFLANKKAV